MSKRRNYLIALKALVASALPSADVRGFDEAATRPDRIGSGGAVLGHPGVPEETDVDLGQLKYYYDHAVPLEIHPSDGSADPAADIDTALKAIGDAVAADRTLSGVVEWIEASSANEEDLSVDGAESIRWAEITITASYSASHALA